MASTDLLTGLMRSVWMIVVQHSDLRCCELPADQLDDLKHYAAGYHLGLSVHRVLSMYPVRLYSPNAETCFFRLRPTRKL